MHSSWREYGKRMDLSKLCSDWEVPSVHGGPLLVQQVMEGVYVHCRGRRNSKHGLICTDLQADDALLSPCGSTHRLC